MEGLAGVGAAFRKPHRKVHVVVPELGRPALCELWPWLSPQDSSHIGGLSTPLTLQGRREGKQASWSLGFRPHGSVAVKAWIKDSVWHD